MDGERNRIWFGKDGPFRQPTVKSGNQPENPVVIQTENPAHPEMFSVFGGYLKTKTAFGVKAGQFWTRESTEEGKDFKKL